MDIFFPYLHPEGQHVPGGHLRDIRTGLMILMDLKIDIGDIKTAILVVRLDSDSSEGSECVYLAYFNGKSGF